MGKIRDQVYSEYGLFETSVLFNDESEASRVGCVGKLEEEMETITVTKKCEGKITKKRTKATGSGTLKITGHFKIDVYRRMFGMTNEELKTGVYAYGDGSVHEEFTLTGIVEDEDGVKKLKAYPKCQVQTGIARSIENGAEEVAECELEVTVMPDKYGQGMYEALVADLAGEDGLQAKWLTKFSSDDMQKSI